MVARKHFTPCASEGCPRLRTSIEWCGAHYQQWRRTGERPTGRISNRRDVLAWVRVLPGGCWEWTGRVEVTGYGYHGLVSAHRVVYERLVGPIPDGLHLDHLCHTDDLSCPGGFACSHRRCVNPAHLEPVTQAENNRRANARITHCPQGHPYTEENTYTCRNGCRSCRTCHRLRERERNRRLRGVAA